MSHVTTSEIILQLFQPLKLFQNYFSDIEQMLENIDEPQ